MPPKLLLPLRRAPRLLASADRLLLKAGPRKERPQSAHHKYLRRERTFANGRLTWRYFYRDDKERATHAPALDPERRHEHRTLSELKKLYPNLAGKALSALDATLEAISRLFGGADKPPPAVKSTPGWSQAVHAPAVAAEASSSDSEHGRSPQARVAKALDLIPQHLKDLVSEKSKGYAGLRDVLLETRAEDDYIGGRGVAGWAHPDGRLRVTELAATRPAGAPKFNSDLTFTEVVVIHEFGHHVHFALENGDEQQRDIISKWQQLGQTPGTERVSEYAHTNWREDWAESFACAISHPRELATRCPERYDFLREHVLPELLLREKVLREPDEALSWWNQKQLTVVGRALAQMRRDQPARRFCPYYSDKDQFYAVSRGGRSVLLRFGPPDKDAEAGWERMPATLDPETGLPRYEGKLYTRFNGYGALKEIYDERGRPLDSKQAYLYLGEDDEKVTAHVQELVGEAGPAAYGQLSAELGAADTAHLGRRMFDALGGNLSDATLDKERARVARARERGESGVLERHDWAPVEISAAEFLAKSGTFKFGAMREATAQPHVLRDKDGSVRTYFDAAAGVSRPVLAVRYYEQDNPDGSRTRIGVHEDESFSAGEAILAPQRVLRDGREVTEWGRYVLGPSDSTDPEQLARALGTTARELLERNHRYGRGQIVDPVLSALLNPGGRRQIRSAQDLLELMRVAAESDPPREAWVSVAGGSQNSEQRAYSHVQVQWDGQGSPLVVGDYWPRKLDKDTVRADELLGRDDRVRLHRVVERQPRRLKVQSGALVFVRDDKTGRRVMARVLGPHKVSGEDEPRLLVQALTGQGAGVNRTVRHLRRGQLEASTESAVPGKPGLRRRLVEPLPSDVLLYADEVPEHSGPDDPGGVIRILLPKDGSLGQEQLKRLPGVREASGGALAPSIAVEDIPRFRAALGGFVMDGRVRASLEQAMRLERARLEVRGSEPLVRAEQLVDQAGNLAPDGLLRGLVTGPEGIQPGPHRVRALQKLAQNGGRMIAAHFMGCLSGDAVIDVLDGDVRRAMRIEQLPDFVGGFGQALERPSAYSLFEGAELRRNRIVEAVASGVRTTYLVRTHGGRSLRATAEHPFYCVRYEGLRADGALGFRSERTKLRDMVLGDVVVAQRAIDDHLDVDAVAFIGEPRDEQTFDLIMGEPARNYVASGLVVSNTGKTAYAIMAAQMMRNLTDAAGAAHPSRTSGRALFVVPLNTAENWFQEFKKFAGSPPTLLGAGSLAGAQQLLKLPERGRGESDGTYRARALEHWREQCRQKPGLWNPFADPSLSVVIGSEYFRDHEEALRLLEQFDGMVVDEAQEVARENETSRAVERWNPQMKMWLALTGTPITNTLDVVPRLVRLVTAGKVDLGTEQQFADRYLLPNAVLRQAGAKNPPKTDINPMRAGELAAILQPVMDVATVADVKGQAMPAVLLDENEPAHMLGQQARMYRAAMAKLSDQEREALALSSSLGLDEKQMLSEEAVARVNVARSLANCPAYKAPDAREELTYKAKVPVTDKKTGAVRFEKQEQPFRLPEHKQLVSKEPGGWRGRYPDYDDVAAGRIDAEYFAALLQHGEHLFGSGYEYLAGKPIPPAELAAIKRGDFVTPTGHRWQDRVPNPDYGPEGMVARGRLDPASGQVLPLTYATQDERGERVVRELKTGTRFVRDPRSKASGLFYHQDDWDFTGRNVGTAEGGGESEQGEVAETAAGSARAQGPKPGRQAMSVQRSPARREQRAQFDAAVTSGNAKCDKLEHWVKNVLSGKTGDPNPELAQFIVFGNRIGSSCRTVESKLRTMGYQDVNEALGPSEYSSEVDKAKTPSKYFVSYMGKGATLGDRNLNSEVFRRAQDSRGRDTGQSVFVARTLCGSSGKPPRAGEVREGWGRSERARIAECFVDQGGPLEVPMRVRGGRDGELVVPEYAYESALSRKERGRVRELEVALRAASGKERERLETEISAVLEPHWERRAPLSARALHVLNNCQFMVASDAANVGLNWPAGYLGMYDSLFSPMQEWQRITRAARMLPPAFSGPLKPLIDKLDANIREGEKLSGSQGPASADYDDRTAMAVVQAAIESLSPEERGELRAAVPAGRDEQLVEGYFARRALDRIGELRPLAEAKLRREGYYPDPTAPRDEAHWVPPVAVNDADVTNYVLREQLSAFERKLLKARRYLVDVQRFTTSVEVPEFTSKIVKGPESGSTRRVRVPLLDADGAPVVRVESPCQAERSQLTQQRAKQRPYEHFLKVVQDAQPAETRYDFVPSAPKSLALTALLPSEDNPALYDLEAEGSVHFAQELKVSASAAAMSESTKPAPQHRGDTVVPRVRDILRNTGRIHGSALLDLLVEEAAGRYSVDSADGEKLIERLGLVPEVADKPDPTPSQRAFLGLQYGKHPGYVPGAKLHFWLRPARPGAMTAAPERSTKKSLLYARAPARDID